MRGLFKKRGQWYAVKHAGGDRFEVLYEGLSEKQARLVANANRSLTIARSVFVLEAANRDEAATRAHGILLNTATKYVMVGTR